MRCKSCNSVLSDKEAVRKSLVTEEYLDMCDQCLGTIQEDLFASIDPEDSFWGDEEPEDFDWDKLNARLGD